MNIRMTTRRARALIAGTLLAGVMSVGVAADTVSAEEAVAGEAKVLDVRLDDGGGHTMMRGGIRW